MNVQSELSFNIEGATELLSSPICDDAKMSELRSRQAIDQANINECFIDQIELISEVATGYEMAAAEAAMYKDLIEGAAAFLDSGVRQTLMAAKEKVTEGRVASMIKSHEDYRALQANYHAAKFNAGRWKAQLETAKQRKDALITLGANWRAEGQGDVSIRNSTVQERIDEYREKMSQE